MGLLVCRSLIYYLTIKKIDMTFNRSPCGNVTRLQEKIGQIIMCLFQLQ